MSAETIIQNRSLIKGFLSPIFFDELRNESALMPDDFRKVRDGYACPLCLCEYTTFLVTCPVCGHKRDLAQDLKETPADWVSHLKERAATEGVDSGEARTFDDFMAQVNANPDIDHTTLKRLGPSKWGKR